MRFSLIPRDGRLRRKFEAGLIRWAIAILVKRNATRALVVSPADSNHMRYIAEKLDSIATRISKNYP